MSKGENVKLLVSKKLLWATAVMALVAPKVMIEYAYWTIVSNRGEANDRLAAFRTLEGMGYFGRGPLLRLLNHENVGRRIQAAESLGHHSNRRVVEALIRAAREDEGVQKQALRSLGRIGDSRAIPAMEELAAESAFAHEPLLWMGPEGRDALMRAINEETGRPGVRAHGLRRLCDEESNSAEISGCVERALRSGVPVVMGAAAKCLGRMGVGAVERLEASLEDPVPEVKVGAAKGLRLLGRDTGLEALRAVAADSEAPEEARSDAIVELREYQDPKDVRLLQRLKTSDSSRMVRRAAASTLKLLYYDGVDTEPSTEGTSSAGPTKDSEAESGGAEDL